MKIAAITRVRPAQLADYVCNSARAGFGYGDGYMYPHVYPHNGGRWRGQNEKPLALEGEGLPWSERLTSLLLVGLVKASLYPVLDVGNPEGDAALAKFHHAGKLS